MSPLTDLLDVYDTWNRLDPEDFQPLTAALREIDEWCDNREDDWVRHGRRPPTPVTADLRRILDRITGGQR